MKKADKIHEIVFELEWELLNPDKASSCESEVIGALGRVLYTMSKNTRYEEDVNKLFELCAKHAPKYFDSSS